MLKHVLAVAVFFFTAVVSTAAAAFTQESLSGIGYQNGNYISIYASDSDWGYNAGFDLLGPSEVISCSGQIEYDPVNVNASAKYGTAAFSTGDLTCYQGTNPNVEVNAECSHDGDFYLKTVGNTLIKSPEGTVTTHGTTRIASAVCTVTIGEDEYDLDESELYILTSE